MTFRGIDGIAYGLLACVALQACGTQQSPSVRSAPHSQVNDQPGIDFVAKARADSARRPYTQADIAFMTGMIGHHAQAVVMASWAPSRGASPAIRRLCERIINAQQDEILIMQNWLRDRLQPVPGALGEPPTTAHGGHHADHHARMPGMLTDAQMKDLDAARGAEFDRLFLTFMIQHHRGAVEMVATLFNSNGGRDELVFKFASDVNVDQATEIARMEKMLAEPTP